MLTTTITPLLAAKTTALAVALPLVGALLFALHLALRGYRMGSHPELRALPKSAKPRPWWDLRGLILGEVQELFAHGGALGFARWGAANFGPVFLFRGLLSLPSLWVTDPSALKHILTRSSGFAKPMAAKVTFSRLTGWHGMLVIEGEEHRKHRKIINPVFNIKNLRKLVPIMDECATEMLDVIDTQPDGSAHRIYELCVSTALNMIGRTAMCTDFDALSRYHKPEILQAYHGLLEFFAMGKYGQVRRAFPVIDYLPLPFNFRYRRNVRLIERHIESILERFSTGKELPDQFSLVNAMFAEIKDGEKLSMDELRSELLTFLAAGHDTTAISLCMTLYELSRHPEEQEKLYCEIKDHIPAAHTMDGTDFDTLNALPYLNQVVNETLRLHSPAYITTRMSTMDQHIPLTKGSFFAPKGITLLIPMQAIHLMESVWGPDAEKWVPERWAKIRVQGVMDQAETESTMHNGTPGSADVLPPAAYMPFLMGTRSCIGKQFALMELKVSLARILSRYRLEAVTEKAEKIYAITAKPKEVVVRCIQRRH